MHRPEGALAVPERGVASLPESWLLWQYLGSCRSDAGDLEGAFAAYEQALACEHDPVSLGYNYAEALARAGRWNEARERMEPLFAGERVTEAEPRLGRYLVNLYEEILRREERDAEADDLLTRYAGVFARAALAGTS